MQGITLEKNDFYFGECVIDEPIEDPEANTTEVAKLQEIYEIQESTLDLVLANTIFRKSVDKEVKLKCRFFYNQFEPNH
ncbi:MAG: hypothetical protein LBF97_01920 [Elusimicrobiota bacterium]|nr:hypothetical protein [Elusimicrobiota bacterium]